MQYGWRLGRLFPWSMPAAAVAGRVAAGLLVAFGVWQAFAGAEVSGLWLILIGWFLWSASEGAARTTTQSALRGTTVETFVNRTICVLDADASVTEAVEQIAGAPPQPLYPVMADGTLLGALTPHDIAHFPVDRWRATSVNWLARHRGPLPTLPLQTDALEALRKLDELQTEALPVTDAAGRCVGTFERTLVLRWLQLQPSLAP